MSLHLHKSAKGGGPRLMVGWLVGWMYFFFWGMRQASSRWSFSGKEALTKVCEVIYEHRTLGSIRSDPVGLYPGPGPPRKGAKKWGTLNWLLSNLAI